MLYTIKRLPLLKNQSTMVKSYYCLLIITFATLLGSCQTVQELSIDYMLPADISFPNSLKRIAVVNNVPYLSDDEIKTVNKSHEKYSTFEETYCNGDPAIAAEALANSIANENYFDEVIICDSALRNHETIHKALSQEEVRTLTKDLNVDFLIAIEDIKINATRKIIFLDDFGYFYGMVDAKVSPTLRIYLPERNAPLVTIAPTDSIFWEEAGYSERMVNVRLINNKELVSQASEFAGIMPLKHILPNWKTASRFLFSDGSINMRDASIYARENNWEKAIQLWKKQYDSKSGKKKMQAACNIALGYEMQDCIASALEWAEKAQDIAKDVDKINANNSDARNSYPNYLLTSLYVNELRQRQDNLKVLSAQMARFTNE